MGPIWVINMNKVIRLILPSSKNCHLWINFVTLNKKVWIIGIYFVRQIRNLVKSKIIRSNGCYFDLQ